MAIHHLDDTQPHVFWDNSLPPRLRIKTDDTVVFETLEASANQVTPQSTHDAVAHLDFGLIHPLTGPVHVEGAEPNLHHYTLGRTHCRFRADIQIPYEPFCGVTGVGPRESGRLTTIPPRENGGNIDIRHLTPGTRVVFPVLVPGALFSCGDCHSLSIFVQPRAARRRTAVKAKALQLKRRPAGRGDSRAANSRACKQ
jgi:acetamidase/formamidase